MNFTYARSNGETLSSKRKEKCRTETKLSSILRNKKFIHILSKVQFFSCPSLLLRSEFIRSCLILKNLYLVDQSHLLQKLQIINEMIRYKSKNQDFAQQGRCKTQASKLMKAFDSIPKAHTSGA